MRYNQNVMRSEKYMDLLKKLDSEYRSTKDAELIATKYGLYVKLLRYQAHNQSIIDRCKSAMVNQ